MISALNSPATKIDRESASMPSRQDFIRAHYRFQDGRFLTSVKNADEAIYTASDVPAPMWNHSTYFGEGAAIAEFLRETEEWHTNHSRRPVIYLIDENDAAALGDGYERFDRETWM